MWWWDRVQGGLELLGELAAGSWGQAGEPTLVQRVLGGPPGQVHQVGFQDGRDGPALALVTGALYLYLKVGERAFRGVARAVVRRSDKYDKEVEKFAFAARHRACCAPCGVGRGGCRG